MSIEEALQAKEELLRVFADTANAFARNTGLTISGVSFETYTANSSGPRYVFDVTVTL